MVTVHGDRRAKREIIVATVAVLVAVVPPGNAVVVQDIVNQVDQASYTWFMTNTATATSLQTHIGDSRNNGTADHGLAMQAIHGFFVNVGLSTTYHTFSSGGTNIIASLPGTGPNASDIYIIGAHYDSVSNTVPGADDNASGVAGVLEAARVLSQYQFDATLMFMAFDQEEDGLRGSWAWVNAFGSSNIKGMVSLDMISWNGNGNQAYVYGQNDNTWALKQALTNSIALYSGGLTGYMQGQNTNSDNWPFDSSGYPGALLIENYSGHPAYHTPNDNVDVVGYLDYLYATRMTRSVVGWMATEAELLLVKAPEPGLLAFWAVGWLLIGVRKKTSARC